MTKLVIVESPAKCKKIEGFLDNKFVCVASFGHIRELRDGLKCININKNFAGDINNFHNFVGVYNQGIASLYINGILETGPTSGGPSALGSNIDETLKIGRLGNVTSYDTTGNISPVHIYNRALSASEVLHNYNALKSRFGL